jgi:hypothetical protein
VATLSKREPLAADHEHEHVHVHVHVHVNGGTYCGVIAKLKIVVWPLTMVTVPT